MRGRQQPGRARGADAWCCFEGWVCVGAPWATHLLPLRATPAAASYLTVAVALL